MNTQQIIVSICGPSGAGKSSVAKELVATLGPSQCVRIPGDVFLMPARGPLKQYHERPLTYDWALLAAVLATDNGALITLPTFDFSQFARLSTNGGQAVRMRPVRAVDALRAYPSADLSIRLTVPAEIRRTRIVVRDQRWGTSVIDRWDQLEHTRRTSEMGDRVDLELDGLSEPIVTARRIATEVLELLET